MAFKWETTIEDIMKIFSNKIRLIRFVEGRNESETGFHALAKISNSPELMNRIAEAAGHVGPGTGFATCKERCMQELERILAELGYLLYETYTYTLELRIDATSQAIADDEMKHRLTRPEGINTHESMWKCEMRPTKK